MTAAPFDPIKAQREILAGLADVHKVLITRTRDAERRLGEVEVEYTQFAKLEAFVRNEIRERQEIIKGLEAEAEARAKGESAP